MPVDLNNGVMRKVAVAGPCGRYKRALPVILECGHTTILRGDMPGGPRKIICFETEVPCLACREEIHGGC